MMCQSINAIQGITDYLVWPTSCDSYIYLKILLTIMAIITWTLYKTEKFITPGGGDIISCLGVSSIAITILTLTGTLIKSSQNVAMIQPTILLIILSLTIPLIVIWFFKD